MGISQVQGGATNAVQAWTKKQDLPRILTTSRRCYELLNRSVIRHWLHVIIIIIHQTHYEKSDWSRAFNQFTIACELDMINAISAADIAFIM